MHVTTHDAPGAAHQRPSPWIWIAIAALVLAFVGADSVARLRTIWAVTGVRVPASPSVTEAPDTLTGYAANQHRLILPTIATDGYHWLMQSERMIAGREGWRVRHVDYDHPPSGREVEWSGLLHWEAAGLAWLGTHVTAIDLPEGSTVRRTRDVLFGPYRPGGLPLTLAMERVAPWANTVNLVLFIAILTPLAARRFGAAAAALLALGFVVIYPFYQFFSAGYFDHHGLAATWDLLMIVLLVGGGAGWLRTDRVIGSRASEPADRLWAWLPGRSQARQWFIASAIAGGAGLWESAASTVPAMIGIGAGALLGMAAFGRNSDTETPWRLDPTLWRTWGLAGGLASLFFYLLEYFPEHLGWNLHVNHPLYALAWLGAGDGLCRGCQWIAQGTLGRTADARRRRLLLIGADVAMVAALPITIAMASRETFVLADPFLWRLCVDYILEIQSLFRQLQRMAAAEILTRISLLPLLTLPVASLLWQVDMRPRARLVWRGLLIATLVPALVFTHGFFQAVISHALHPATSAAGGAQPDALSHALAGLADLLIVGVLFLLPIVRGTRTLASPLCGLLALALLPALVFLILALGQSRWTGIDAALWLGVALPLSLPGVRPALHGWSMRAGMTLLIAAVAIPVPASALSQWAQSGLRAPVTQMDLAEVVTRDAAQRLRQRLGSEPGVLVGGPTTTSWMVFFGGFDGLGTLYSENLDGLKAVASIYSANSPEEALALCRRYGVTHFAIFSWDAFAEEYARLWRGLRRDDPLPADAFILRILRNGNIPPWLRPIPYAVPPELGSQWVRLFEVVPDQTLEEATVRTAGYLSAQGKPDAAATQLGLLLERVPDYLPALVSLARLQQARGDAAAFALTMQRVRSHIGQASAMDLDDRVDLALVLALTDDAAGAREQMTEALARADETSIRRLLPETLLNLVRLSWVLDVTERYPATFQLAFNLLPEETRAALADQGVTPRRD